MKDKFIIMDKMFLETIIDEDIELIKQWLQKDYIKNGMILLMSG